MSPEIERRIEVTGRAPDFVRMWFGPEAVRRGAHRAFVGGKWEPLGKLQLDFLTTMGLRPTDTLLDVGCGPLRAGRRFIDYLQPGHYYGIDASRALIRAGYDAELTAEQRVRTPAGNLRASDRFDADFGVRFDMAIAQSLFPNLSLNQIRLCLSRVAQAIKPGGRFYASFFEAPDDTELDAILPGSGRRRQLSERQVFWYYREDLNWASRFGPWRYRYVGDWHHPAGQKMVEFTRLAHRVGGAPMQQISPATRRLPPKLQRLVTHGRRSLAARLDPDVA
ncbi:MAG: class I SAM-dependent methyltransferase [Actinomycetota bacterium]|nr:class I SAM-dependent methyltransferase [Actinomycetota bacterium]